MTTMAHIVEYEDAKKMVELGVNILAHNVRDREIDHSPVSHHRCGLDALEVERSCDLPRPTQPLRCFILKAKLLRQLI